MTAFQESLAKRRLQEFRFSQAAIPEFLRDFVANHMTLRDWPSRS